MCEFSEYGLEAEWGDYIRLHAGNLVLLTGAPIGSAIATVKLCIIKGIVRDDLAEYIAVIVNQIEGKLDGNV